MERPPAQLGPELGGVDRVAAIVAGAVADPVEGVLGPAHGTQDLTQDGQVVPLAVRADEIGLAIAAAREDLPYRGAVVLGVNPVADVPPVPVELGADAAQDVGDLTRDELLHVLVGSVVVGAVGDCGAQAVGAGPGADEHVRACLGGAVGAARAIRRLLGEARRVIQGQVAVDLVGGDVVVANVVPAAGLEQAVGAHDVRLDKGFRAGNGVVVVGLRGVVDDRVVPGDDAIEQLGVADVAHDELHAVFGQASYVLGVACVGELVQHRHVHAGVVVDHVVHEVGADETAAAGDDYVGGLEDV